MEEFSIEFKSKDVCSANLNGKKVVIKLELDHNGR